MTNAEEITSERPATPDTLRPDESLAQRDLSHDNTAAPVFPLPASLAEFTVLKTAELERLYTDLTEHIAVRDGQRPSGEVSWGVCVAVLAGPHECGVPPRCPDLLDVARKLLNSEDATGFPEATICMRWVTTAFSTQPDVSREEPDNLAVDQLWPPAQVLRWRALAWAGKRQELGRVLPADSPLSAAAADAWLDTASESIPVNSEGADGLVGDWHRLVRVETALLADSLQDADLQLLERLAALQCDADQPITLESLTVDHVSARAAAALARSRMANSQGIDDLAELAGWHLLPAWEKKLLTGLSALQCGDHSRATSDLEEGVALNGQQTSLRLALAAVQAPHDPEEALATLDVDSPTHEVLITRAAIEARLKRYPAASETLFRVTAGNVGCEPVRYSWRLGRRQYRQQERLLRTALAETTGSWSEARDAWRVASEKGMRKSKKLARQLFAARHERVTQTDGHGWKRSVLRQTLRRGRAELGQAPLIGDTLFFAADAFWIDDPSWAVAGFKRLLRQRQWVQRERRTGHNRLVYLGDALLRAGCVEDAIRAYEQCGVETESVHGRLAIARLAEGIRQAVDAQEATERARRACELVADDYRPAFLAALLLLAADDPEGARGYLGQSKERGGPDVPSRCLELLIAGAWSELAAMLEEDEPTSVLPACMTSIVRVLADSSNPAYCLQFMREAEAKWVELSPVDPVQLAARAAIGLGDKQRWSRLHDLSVLLSREGEPCATRLAGLCRIWHLLATALDGDFNAAEQGLAAAAVTTGEQESK